MRKLLGLACLILPIALADGHVAFAENINCRAVAAEKIEYETGSRPPDPARAQQLFNFYMYYCVNPAVTNNITPPILTEFVDPNYPSCHPLNEKYAADATQFHDLAPSIEFWCFGNDLRHAGWATLRQQQYNQQQEQEAAEAFMAILGVAAGMAGGIHAVHVPHPVYQQPAYRPAVTVAPRPMVAPRPVVQAPSAALAPRPVGSAMPAVMHAVTPAPVATTAPATVVPAVGTHPASASPSQTVATTQPSVAASAGGPTTTPVTPSNGMTGFIPTGSTGPGRRLGT